MSPLGVRLLMLLAAAGFSLLAWRKLQIVMALQPQPRWDQPGQRLGSVLVNGFFQRRMVKREWKPGLMHAVIFLGFLALSLRPARLERNREGLLVRGLILSIMLTDFAFDA